MDYINTVQAADKWNISTTRVTILAKEGRIEGAIQMGARWLIPKDAKKPVDGRTKKAKVCANSVPDFRFFLNDLRPVEEFLPPLSEEETRIRNAYISFHACDFNVAEKNLSNMHLTSKNIYNRIYSLFASCLIDVMLGKSKEFLACYEKLNAELLKDFPRKNELSCLPYEIDCILGATEYFINDFRIDSTYKYHDTYSTHLAYMSTLSFLYSNRTFKEKDVIPYELLCDYVDKTYNFADSQTIHFDLGVIYSLMNKKEEMTMHIKKGLEIGLENKHYWVPSLIFLYYRNIIEPVLDSFPEDYRKLIISLSEDIERRFSKFMEVASKDSFFNAVLSSKFIYVFYALQGYSSKDVANIMGTTESYVNNVYSKIYASLNVPNKKEMIEYYLQSNINSMINNK